MTREELQAEIDAELARIGADYAGLGPCSSVRAVVGPDADSGVPENYVRYYDDHASAVCKTERFFEALKSLPEGYCQGFDNTDFWEAFPVDELPD